jgi:hypothetical protein
MAVRKKTGRKVGKPKAAKARPDRAKAAPPVPASGGMVALATAVPVPEAVLHAKAGDTLTLTATTRNAVVPYAVSYDKKVRLFQLVNGTATMDVGSAGGHTIGWAFNELPAQGWEHGLSAQVGGGPPVVLLKGTAAAGDDGFASGHATVVVS